MSLTATANNDVTGTGVPPLFEVTCPHCEKAYHLSPERVGRHQGAKIQCKACRGVFIMPEPPTESDAASESGGSLAGLAAEADDPAEGSADEMIADDADVPGSTPWESVAPPPATPEPEVPLPAALPAAAAPPPGPVSDPHAAALRLEVGELRRDVRRLRAWLVVATLLLLAGVALLGVVAATLLGLLPEVGLA